MSTNWFSWEAVNPPPELHFEAKTIPETGESYAYCYQDGIILVHINGSYNIPHKTYSLPTQGIPFMCGLFTYESQITFLIEGNYQVIEISITSNGNEAILSISSNSPHSLKWPAFMITWNTDNKKKL